MNEYGRWARRRLGASLGSVQKCNLCKTTWLYGMDRRRMGICTRCERMALKRKEILDTVTGSDFVEGAKWIDGWPGRLEIEFARHYGRTLRQAYVYGLLEAIPHLERWLGIQRETLLSFDDE